MFLIVGGHIVVSKFMAGSHVPTKVVESKQMKHLVRELYSPENISFPTNASEEKQTIESVIFGPLR